MCVNHFYKIDKLLRKKHNFAAFAINCLLSISALLVCGAGKFKVGMDHRRFDINALELLNPDELKLMLQEQDHDGEVRGKDDQVL